MPRIAEVEFEVDLYCYEMMPSEEEMRAWMMENPSVELPEEDFSSSLYDCDDEDVGFSDFYVSLTPKK